MISFCASRSPASFELAGAIRFWTNAFETSRRIDQTSRLLHASNYDGLADNLALPDPNDLHVVAAAIRSNAQVIVTFNLKDFPNEVLAPIGIEAKHPDDFLLDAIGIAPGAVATVVSQQAATLKAPPVTRAEVLDRLRECGLEQSVAQLRLLFGAAV